MLNVGREDESKEFKKSTVELEKGLVSLTAMLNKHCKGEVLFGVKGNGDVIGQDIGKNTLRSITRSVSNFIDPHITPTVTVLTAEDGKKYISLTAEAHDRPYLFKGTAYIRSGEEDRKALHSDLRRMLLSSGDMLMETESKNQDLKFDELFDLFKSHGLTANKTRSFYNSIGLLNHEGRFNIQAEMLSDQNRHPLTVAIFSGNDKTSLLMRRDFSGHSLLLEVKSVLDYIETMNEKFVDVTGPTRKETDLFDYPAFKEAWINACVHNNWIGQIPPSIYIFDDRIEILSYGDRPYWLSDEGFFGARACP